MARQADVVDSTIVSIAGVQFQIIYVDHYNAPGTEIFRWESGVRLLRCLSAEIAIEQQKAVKERVGQPGTQYHLIDWSNTTIK